MYHEMSKKHLGRHVNAFVGRHNVRDMDRDMDTNEQMEWISLAMKHKNLPSRHQLTNILLVININVGL